MGRDSIGGTLYLFKISLDTAGIFALTVVIILLSLLFEKAALFLLKKGMQWQPKCAAPSFPGTGREEQHTVLTIKDGMKAFGDRQVLNHEEGSYRTGEVYYFREASGTGKTTRFRVIAGLTDLDSGTVVKNQAVISVLFQEDRLCEEYSAVKNLEMVCGDAELSKDLLTQILPKDCLQQPCRELSGGMKRRVALARAFCIPSNLVLLDEPYTGLDEENEKLVKRAVDRWRKGRCVLIASHLS